MQRQDVPVGQLSQDLQPIAVWVIDPGKEDARTIQLAMESFVGPPVAVGGAVREPNARFARGHAHPQQDADDAAQRDAGDVRRGGLRQPDSTRAKSSPSCGPTGSAGSCYRRRRASATRRRRRRRPTSNRRRPSVTPRTSRSVERRAKVVEQVVDVFDSDREPKQAVGDAAPFAFLCGNRAVRHARRGDRSAIRRRPSSPLG